MSKTLPDGVVLIRNKPYETVALRVSKFRERHPDWSLLTAIIERTDTVVCVEASILDPSGRVVATGHAEEYRKSSEINRTSALENCETSAIGRCLACFGLGGTEFASADEVARAVSGQKGAPPLKADMQHAPARLAWESLDDSTQDYCRRLSTAILGAMPDADKALEVMESEQIDDPTVKAGLWYLLDSTTRAALKKAAEKARAENRADPDAEPRDDTRNDPPR